MSFVSVSFASRNHTAITWVSQFLSFYLNHVTLQTQEKGKYSQWGKGELSIKMEHTKVKLFFSFKKSGLLYFSNHVFGTVSSVGFIWHMHLNSFLYKFPLQLVKTRLPIWKLVLTLSWSLYSGKYESKWQRSWLFILISLVIYLKPRANHLTFPI